MDGSAAGPVPDLPRPRRLPGHPAGDLHAAAWAVATCVGALVAHPLPPALAGVPAGASVLLRRPLLLALALVGLSSSLAARAEAGMTPLDRAPWAGVVTLVDDPRPAAFGMTVLARADGHQVRLRATGPAGGVLAHRLAGERVRVTGRTGPLDERSAHLRIRHVVGVLVVDRLEVVDGGSPPWRAANRLRRLLEQGAASLPDDERSVFLGLVLGDDRHQSLAVADDFRGAGLTHLLVVSGQNVAFALAAAAPLLARLPRGWRTAVALGVLAGFTVITRAEPSVLRAVAMAGLAAVAQGTGRPAAGMRILALAVSATVLADPFLVRSVGFQLSVAAAAGILALGGPLARSLPGPRALAAALAVPAAAQLAVAPLLIWRFGGVPVASVPANVLVEPAAAAAATWGLPAGLAGGALGGSVASVLQVPTGLLLRWVLGVARVLAHLPLGQLGAPGVVLAAIGLGLLASARPRGNRRVRRTGTALLSLALLAPSITLHLRPPPPHEQLAEGAELWRRGRSTVLVLQGSPWAPDVLASLRDRAVRRIDLLVVRAGPAKGHDLVAAVTARRPVATVWWVDGRGDGDGTRSVGSLRVSVTAGEVTVAAV